MGRDTIIGSGGDDTVRGGKALDTIFGGDGNDRLFGNGGRDMILGEGGSDLIVGGKAKDVLIGGLGKDIFDFNAAVESRVGVNHDLIQAFSRAQDHRIDLRTIDAETGAGNQAFHFIGNVAFSGDKGELRFAAGLVQGDTDGNGIANFEIKVGGLGGSAAVGDFFL